MHFTNIAAVSVAIIVFVSQNVSALPVNSIKDVEYNSQDLIKISKQGIFDSISDVRELAKEHSDVVHQGIGQSREHFGGETASGIVGGAVEVVLDQPLMH